MESDNQPLKNPILHLIRAWMAWVLPRPRIVLALALLSALLAFVYSSRHMGVQTDQLELISPDHPLIELSDRVDIFKSDGNALIVVIEAPTPDRALSFLRALVPRIEADTEHFASVFYRVDPDLFKDWALLYLDRDDLLELRDTLREYSEMLHELARHPSVPAFLALVNEEMTRRMVGELFTGFLDEGKSPNESRNGREGMNLEFLIHALQGLANYLTGTPSYISPWSSFFTRGQLDLEYEGYFWEGQKRFLIVSVIPKKKKGTLTRAEDALKQLRTLILETQTAHPEVRAGVTGRQALNDDQMATVLGDMDRATWFSLVGVLSLMVAFRGSVRRPLIQMVALVTGLCWTFGWATLVVGHLNMLSVVFAPLLIGLGDDFGIHWFSRFEEEERLGVTDRRSVIRRVMDSSGPGILLAAVGTSLSFLAFVLTGFRGLMELGMIAGVGTFLMLFAYFTILPALSVLMAGNRRKAPVPETNPEERQRLLRISPPAARWILGAMLVLCVLSVGSASSVTFDLNPLRLQAENAEAVVWEKRLVENSQQSILYCEALADSPENLKARVRVFEALPTVAVVETLFSFLPEDQDEKLALLRSFLAEIPDSTNSTQTFGQQDAEAIKVVLERIRFKMREDQAGEWGADAPTVEQMARVRALSGEVIEALQASPESLSRLRDYQARFRDDVLESLDFIRRGASASPMAVENIPTQVKERFYQPDSDAYLIRIYPKESVWESGALSRFIESLQSVDPQVVGDPVSLYVFSDAFKRACLMAALYALISIFVVLCFSFQNLRLALLALVPLGVGTLWTVAIMGWMGMQFNLANGIFMPLVLAAGVEYGVIILHRWNEGGTRAGELPFSTLKGVILAALTTTVGFGALMLSEHRGIFSLGYVAAVGSLCVLAAAIIILPSLLSSFAPSKTQ